MTDSRFSIQQGYRPEPQPLAMEDIPLWVRKELLAITRQLVGENAYFFYTGLWPDLRPYLRQAQIRAGRDAVNIRIEPSGSDQVKAVATQLLETEEWHTVLDLCQVLFRAVLVSHGTELAERLASNFNQIFQEAGVVWRMNGDKIEHVISQSTAESIQAARNALSASRFDAPNSQFATALKQFHELPPNHRDCINNAVEAVEGVARIVANNSSGLLSNLLDTQQFRVIHTTLRDALKKFYAFRGDVTSHGQTGAKDEFCEVEEAEFLLGICANSIVYLDRKFPEMPTN